VVQTSRELLEIGCRLGFLELFSGLEEGSQRFEHEHRIAADDC